MSQYSSKDTIDRLLRNQPVDRMGIKDCYWHETLLRWESESHINKISSDPKLFYEDRYDISDVIPFDMVSAGGFFDAMPFKGFSETIQETEDWIISKSGGGATTRSWKKRSGTPEHIAFDMTCPEIWNEKFRPLLLDFDPERVSVEYDKKALTNARSKDKFAYFGHKLFFELQREMMGDVCMLESMLLEPEWILDFNEVYTNFYIKHFTYLFEQAGVPDGMWFYEDLAYKNSPFCSPATLRELYLPYYKRIVDFIHGYGIPVVFHSCGMVEKSLPVVVESGIDALNPIEIKAGCDLLRIAEQYKDQLTFIGGIDVRILESGDRNAIKTEIEQTLTSLKKLGARYIFSSDHSISPAVSFDDFQYAIEVFRKNMFY